MFFAKINKKGVRGKYLISLVLAVGCALSISGCGSSGSVGNSSGSTYSGSSSSSYSKSSGAYNKDSDSGSSMGTKKTCIACHGLGEVQQYYTNDPLEEPHWETCALCHGKGYYYE